MSNYNLYQNPLNERYTSKEMSYVFSPEKKFITWRKFWVALAEAEKELGIDISDEQIEELKSQVDNINFEDANRFEKEVRHDVMAHVKAYGKLCPKAKGIIHLGATSAYVGDNTDIVNIKDAMEIVILKLANLMNNLKEFSLKYKDLPTLGYTHYQPAQLTTVGKRATLWMQDLLLDYSDLKHRIDTIKLRGVKGTTGTQASFLSLFDNDHDKVKQLNEKVCNKMGFNSWMPVSGQTYSRKVDYQVLSVLCSIAQSMHKMTNDLRLLQNLKEIEEPFEKNQIGSSAMAYKRNPMRSERISSLSKYVISQSLNPALIHSTQWFERTLDDSANRRMSIPEAFMAIDSILEIGINVTQGLVVYEKMIRKHVMDELPFMATENILMEAVKKGGDRQELHEKIRIYSMEAGKRVKMDGLENNLMELILSDDEFNISEEELKSILAPENFIGRSSQQVEEFMKEEIDPILDLYSKDLGLEIELDV